MSILVYKQRHRHPNKKSTPGANYAHIRYIATRPRVLKREGAKHAPMYLPEAGQTALWELSRGSVSGIFTFLCWGIIIPSRRKWKYRKDTSSIHTNQSIQKKGWKIP